MTMEGKRVCLLALALLAHGAQVNCIRPTPVAKLSTVALDMQTEMPSIGRSLLSDDTVPLRNTGNMLGVAKATVRTLVEANDEADPFVHPRYMLDAPSKVPAPPVAEPAASEPGPPTVPATTTESFTQVVTQLPPIYSPQPTLPLPPSPYSPSPAVERPSPSPSVTLSPSVTPSPSPSPSPSVQPVEPAPTCSNPDGCLTVSPSSGTVFDTFTLSTNGWQRAWTTESEILVYEFGVEASSSRKARQLSSALKIAIIVGLGSGQQTLYVCARAATVTIRGNAKVTAPSGAKACATVTVAVSDQVSQAQVSDQLAALTFATANNASSSAKPSPSETLAMTARLAAVSSVTSNSSSAETKAAVASLASSLLKNLISSTTSSSSPASVVDTAAIFSGMNTLLAMASEDSRAAVMVGASHMAEALSSTPVSVEEAGPVVDFFTSMLKDTASLIASAAASAGGGAANASQAAADGVKSVLASLMRGTAALTQGLLNGAASNGTVVQISTAKLAAAVKKASAALAAAGVTMQVAPPPASASAGSAGRRLLQSAASTVTASLNPAVGSLCNSDPDCVNSGMGVQVTVIRDTSLLLTSLGGTAAPLAANMSDYRAGGAASIVSQVVRVVASGIPLSAVGLGSLVVLDLPVNLTTVAAGPVNSKRVIVRLQDFGAAALEPAVGIAAGPSATVTHDNGAAVAADLVSGYSDRLGDFVVLQYEAGANVNAGDDASQPPSQPPAVRPPLQLGNTAGPAALPSSLLTSLMVGLATAIAAVVL